MIRFLTFAKNVLVSNFTELALPYKLTYILTFRCQYQCRMCNIWKKSRSEINSELTLEQIDKFFTKNNRFSWINLSGGELFLRRDLLDILSIIGQRCNRLCALNFPTNGAQPVLIANSVKAVLAETDIPRLVITVSLNGPPRIHDEIAGVNGAWQNAIKTFKQLSALKSRRFSVFLGTTLQPTNMHIVPAMVNAVKQEIPSIGYKNFHFNLVHYSSHYYGNQLQQETGQCAATMNKDLWAVLSMITKKRRVNLLEPVNYIEHRYHSLAKTYLLRGRTPLGCQALGASLFMDPSGDIFPCSIYDKRAGNIADFNFDLRQLWADSNRRRIRGDIRRGQCPQCWTPCDAYPSILSNIFSIN